MRNMRDFANISRNSTSTSKRLHVLTDEVFICYTNKFKIYDIITKENLSITSLVIVSINSCKEYESAIVLRQLSVLSILNYS